MDTVAEGGFEDVVSLDPGYSGQALFPGSTMRCDLSEKNGARRGRRTG